MDNGIKVYDLREERYVNWEDLDDVQKEEMAEMFLTDCETYEAQSYIMDMYINIQCNKEFNTHCLKN
jgi:hypothetical protein